MSETIVVLGVIVVVVIAGLFWVRHGKHAATANGETTDNLSFVAPETQITKLRAAGRFWGYKVESHCRASSNLAGRRFAFDDASPLPIDACDREFCGCCMVGLPEQRKTHDRRSGHDRRRSIRIDKSDRRTSRPRRCSEHDSWGSFNPL